MRKILRLLLLFVLGLLLISCNINTNNNDDIEDQPSNIEQPTPEVNPTPEENPKDEQNPSDKETSVVDPNPDDEQKPDEEKTPVVDPNLDDEPINIDYDKKVNLSYEFVGDEKDKAGFAQGYITIEPLVDAKKDGFYLVFLANEEGLLEAYDEFASLTITGQTATYYVKDGRYLPSEATLLAVFESTTRTLTTHPNIATAADIIRIPHAKQLDLGEELLTLGMTSDVHINYETLGFGSKQKWKNTLNFFDANNTDYVIITGDMTGEADIEADYTYYIDTIKNSNIPLNNVYEAIGNHGNTPSLINYFTQTSSSNEVHPYENSPYYHVVLQNNVFIFMAQELQGPSDSAVYDNFSKAQIDWLEKLLKKYGSTNKNVFITIHSPFLNFGPGDRHNGDYVRMITFKEEYTQTMRLKGLLETYKDAIILSGHTHLTYYEGENYSNENDSFARMIHVSSGTQTSSYNHGTKLISDTDGRVYNSTTYGSEGYIVKIYEDYILFIGYNISTGKIIPQGHILLPKKAYGGTFKEPGSEIIETPEDLYSLLEGDGTIDNPYQISTEEQFYALTKAFKTSTTKEVTEMLGYNKYFIQTRDLDMTRITEYEGTNASGSTRYTFAGTYNGNGYTINVNVDDSDNRSIFPYVYGNIVNLRITGKIGGTTCAQPIRALYGNIINCIFDLELTAPQVAGIVYSNYGYIYNVYTTGTLTADNISPIAIGNNSTSYHNIYYNYANTSSDYGTYSTNLNEIVTNLNNLNHSEHKTATSKINGISLNKIVSTGNSIDFE